jgi:uncharacterized membrane protein YdbT with pleckstrin-like domain
MENVVEESAEQTEVESHPIYHFRRSLIAIAFGLFPYLGSLMCSYLIWNHFTSATENSTPTWFHFARIALGLEFIRRYFNSLYTFRDEHVRAYDGLLSLQYRKSSIKIRDIRDIRTRQTLLGRLLGFGSLDLGTAASSTHEVVLQDINQPRKVAAILETLRRSHRLSKEGESIFGLKD